MRVGDVMTTGVTTVDPGDTLDFAENLMAVERVRHLPVVEDDVLVGLLSHRDILGASVSSLRNPTDEEDDRAKRHSHVRDAMRTSVETVNPDTDLVRAADTMLAQKVGSLPVVEGKRLVGIVTESDFVRIVRDLLLSDQDAGTPKRSFRPAPLAAAPAAAPKKTKAVKKIKAAKKADKKADKKSGKKKRD